MKQKRQNLVSKFFNESILWGGLPYRRIDIVKELQEGGYARKDIDFIMFTLHDAPILKEV